MASQATLYVFGDHTYDVQPGLKQLLLHRDNPLLDDFLKRAYRVLVTEICDLSGYDREGIPCFTCIEDLVLQENREKRCVALDMSATSIYQLGTFISQVDCWTLSGDACVLGLGTGALTAAAVSCSRSALELIPMALDMIAVAFKLGVLVAAAAQRIEPSDDLDQHWSVAVPNKLQTEALQEACEQSASNRMEKLYLNASWPHETIVSGPPSSLIRFCHSQSLASSKQLDAYGPYHAPHIYSGRDVTHISSSVAAASSSHHEIHIPVLSGSGATIKDGNFEIIATAAVDQILLQAICWDEILSQLKAFSHGGDYKNLNISPIGTDVDQLICAAFENNTEGMPLPVVRVCSRVSTPSDVHHAHPRKAKLAILGMSGRFPGANSNEAFWDLLCQGLDVHKPTPASRWDNTTHVNVDGTGTQKNKSATPFGCWLDDPDQFDARFFNVSPREAPQVDPAHRLALMTAYEAIEHAGIVPDATPSTRRDRVGVFYGVTSNDWMETNSAQDIDTYYIPGGNRAFIPGRINYFFNFSGPSFAVDTACSSSLAGIHLACNALWQGDIDMAIAGGTNVLTNPDFTAGLDKGHFLSRTGNCKTFDDSADGYCRGEGIGTVIIKRYDDAIADNDPILALILGACTNHSAESESITRPHVGAQRAVFRQILSQGGIDARTVSYVEMHGTGTKCGDAGEMTSVLDVFAPPHDGTKRRQLNEPLHLGSVKANIGHGEAASGISSLIKVLLMLQENTIVPHCGIKTKINHNFPIDLSERNVKIAQETVRWERRSHSRRAFINNFSAAGGNSALLIEDSPVEEELPPDKSLDNRDHHLIAISAKSKNSLQSNLQSMIAFLNQHAATPLNVLSFTTTARRMHHPHRVMVSGSTVNEVVVQLNTAALENTGATRAKKPPKIVFVFTGQGAQYPGMGRQLFESLSRFQYEICRLDHIGQTLGFASMLPVILSDEKDLNNFTPTLMQLASVCLQIALSKLWASWNIFPTAVLGHSMGEYAALNVAGVLSDVDTINLVGKRAQLLEKNCSVHTHAMLVVKSSVEKVASILRDQQWGVACINSPCETVLAGLHENVIRWKNLLSESGVAGTLLKVPYAFHTSQMDHILLDFAKTTSKITFRKAEIPLISSLHGNIVEQGDIDAEYLLRQTRQTVNMFQALKSGYDSQILTPETIVLELGPHPACGTMVKGVLGKHMTCLASLQRGNSPWKVLCNTLKVIYATGRDINWSEYHRDFKSSHTVIKLPAYNWDLKRYWIQYRHDWSLRKGDPPLTINNTARLESTTIHKVIHETCEDKQVRLIVEANIARRDLKPLVQGHEVDGVPLCTPSVYADIALSLGRYLLECYSSSEHPDCIMDVADMTISKALVLRSDVVNQVLQAHVEADMCRKVLSIKFISFDHHQQPQQHAQCLVRLQDRDRVTKLQQDAVYTRQKMQDLQNGVANGVTARFNRPMVYRAIRPLARFNEAYRGISEVILNSNTLEASSHLDFNSVQQSGGKFYAHPAIVDALTQSCGFTMNCNDDTDLDKEVFMNHGWKSFQIFESLQVGKKYTTYTQMIESTNNMWRGDVTIFDGQKVVAYFGQVTMQRVARRVLKVILSMESEQKPQRQRTPAKTPRTPTAAVSFSNTRDISAAQGTDSGTLKSTNALSIITDESGLALSDLTDSTVFGDVGIDSLLGLIIAARLKEELGMETDSNGLFYEYPTVCALKAFLDEGPANVGTDATMRPEEAMSTTATSSSEANTPATEEEQLPPSIDFERAIQIISEESGIAVPDLTDDTDFADSGIDSLLSLVIVSRLRDEFGLDLQHDIFFGECSTIAKLEKRLRGNTDAKGPSFSTTHSELISAPPPGLMRAAADKSRKPLYSDCDDEAPTARKRAVDAYVSKYAASFAPPVISGQLTALSGSANIVLVTGASGSLGCHLVDHLAHLPEVHTVVCLNREKNLEPYLHQEKAMTEKGIPSFNSIRPKLLVLQGDTSKSLLGLSASDYDVVVNSVTHLIHNAWPMSAKRPLASFEPQFQTMRNLINFSCDVVGRRAASFTLSFQLVSSIGVVGHHSEQSVVPEERVGIEAVLPNGYSDAKWGCERMLDETLHKYPNQFRTMVVRLGQIAGSRTSGYWNPMEHFAFLLKSSQTLNALPDVEGTAYWTPVNDVAAVLSELVLADRTPNAVYHIENPVGQSWRELNAILADALHISNLIPFKAWVELVRRHPQQNNPAATLLEFLESNYVRMSCGGLILDTTKTVAHSEVLSTVGPISEEVVRKYIHFWKGTGFLR